MASTAKVAATFIDSRRLAANVFSDFFRYHVSQSCKVQPESRTKVQE
jgi:hypothetical protein